MGKCLTSDPTDQWVQSSLLKMVVLHGLTRQALVVSVNQTRAYKESIHSDSTRSSTCSNQIFHYYINIRLPHNLEYLLGE